MQKVFFVVFLSLFAFPFQFVNASQSEISRAMFSAKISPDGEYLALGMYQNDEQTLVVLDSSSFEPVGGVRLPHPKQVGDFTWVNTQRLVVEVLESRAWQAEPVSYGELYSVNFDGTKGQMIYGYSAVDITTGSHLKKRQRLLGFGKVVDTLPENDKFILVSSTPMDTQKVADLLVLRPRQIIAEGYLPELFRVNVYTGLSTQIRKAPQKNGRFEVDEAGNVQYLAAAYNNENVTKTLLNMDAQHKVAFNSLKNAFSGSEVDVINYTDDESKWIVRVNSGGAAETYHLFNRDTMQVIQL